MTETQSFSPKDELNASFAEKILSMEALPASHIRIRSKKITVDKIVGTREKHIHALLIKSRGSTEYPSSAVQPQPCEQCHTLGTSKDQKPPEQQKYLREHREGSRLLRQ